MSFGKTLAGFLVYGLTIGVVLVALGVLYVSDQTHASGPLDETTEFIVSNGMGTRAIAAKLQSENIIKHSTVFLIATRLKRSDSQLKAGEYLFEKGISVNAVINRLRNGAVIRRNITLPEGLTSYEIVQRLNLAPNLTGEITQIPKEGVLLPETYSYQRGEDRNKIVERMNDAMVQTLKELLPRRAKNLPFKTTNEIVTLASIVEKETAIPSERKRVAGVFVNRLRRGMPLQTDPTVIYAITKGKHKNDGKGPLGRRLLRKDLKYDSPYNTYLYPGLPPGPIANPGYASIEAVLNPEEHDYIFFVADGTGGHVFAKTLDEHNRNVAKWRKIRVAR